MTTKAEQSIEVNVPVSTAYGQWTQFEDFPHFMGGVKEVRQLDDKRMHWVAEIAGVRREWEATVVEQVPDQKVAWAATSGATNAGAVRFEPSGAGSTMVHLTLEYEPEGLVEQVGDKLGIVQRQIDNDLKRFKSLIEDQGYASGAWRGSIAGAGGTPGVEDAAASRGDDGKAGVSAKAVVAGAAAVVGGLAAAAALSGSDEEQEQPVATTPPAPVTPVETVTPIAPVETVTPVAPVTPADPDLVGVHDPVARDAIDVDDAGSDSRTL
jgi:carbon monoxide dehydrogenase subunit G